MQLLFPFSLHALKRPAWRFASQLSQELREDWLVDPWIHFFTYFKRYIYVFFSLSADQTTQFFLRTFGQRNNVLILMSSPIMKCFTGRKGPSWGTALRYPQTRQCCLLIMSLSWMPHPGLSAAHTILWAYTQGVDTGWVLELFMWA